MTIFFRFVLTSNWILEVSKKIVEFYNSNEYYDYVLMCNKKTTKIGDFPSKEWEIEQIKKIIESEI